MDSIFDAHKSAIVQSYLNLQQRKADLDAVSKAEPVDRTRLFAAVDAVNDARTALEKANLQMLLEIRQQLDPQQLRKLDSLP